MFDPVSIGILAGASLLGGLAQAYVAADANKDATKERKGIRDAFEALKPPGYNLDISAPPEYHMEMLKSPEFQKELASPQYNFTRFTPEKLKEVARYAPQLAPLIKEIEPTLIKQQAEMQRGSKAQLHALDELERVAKGGFNPIYQQKVEDASRRAQQEIQSHHGAISDLFNRRGSKDSGLQYAAHLNSGIQQHNALALANQRAASDAYGHQLDALSKSAELGGKVYGQHERTQNINQDAINNFNSRFSKNAQNQANVGTDLLNHANERGIKRGEHISDANIGSENDAAKYNVENMNDLVGRKHAAAVQQQGRSDQLKQYDVQHQRSEIDRMNAIKQIISEHERSGLQNQNDLKHRAYQDQIQKENGKAGISGQIAGQHIQRGQDINQGIAGLNSAVQQLGMHYGDQQQRKESENRFYDYMNNKNAPAAPAVSQFQTPSQQNAPRYGNMYKRREDEDKLYG